MCVCGGGWGGEKGERGDERERTYGKGMQGGG